MLLEALSSLKPVIFSDIPENMEIADSLGISFKNRDADDLALKILFVLNNPELLNKKKDLIINKLSSIYNWESVVKQYINIYRMAIQVNLAKSHSQGDKEVTPIKT